MLHVQLKIWSQDVSAKAEWTWAAADRSGGSLLQATVS